MKEWIDQAPEFGRVDGRPLAVGDLVLFAQDHLHFAVILDDGNLIHALNPGGVQLGRTDDPTFMGKLACAWCVKGEDVWELAA